MASKDSLRPRVYRLGVTDYRLDLRGKKYSPLLVIVSDGKKSLQFSSRAAADRKADEIVSMLQRHGSQRMEKVAQILGEDLNALYGKLAPYNRTLTEAVNHYVDFLASQREKESTETLGVLVDDWLTDKQSQFEKGTLRQRTLQTLRLFGGKYKQQWGNRRVGTITHHEIKTWLDSLRVPLGDSAVSRISSTYERHHLSYLSQFFIWCRKKTQTPRDNPCENLEVKSETAEPEYLTVDECKKLLKQCLRDEFVDLLPFHVICLFAGVRPKECERLEWKDVDFDDSSLVVPKGHAKTRNARRIEMLPTLNTWLKWFRHEHPNSELIPTDFDRKLKTFRREFGKWTHNGMRHSFASYYLSGVKKDFGSLEANMGNSRLMLQKHYVRFPAKNNASMFWKLTPAVVMEDEPEKNRTK